MNDTYFALTLLDVGLAAFFVLAAGILSLLFQLGVMKSLLIGAIRAALQLGLAGVALSTVFGLNRWWLVGLLALLMVALAGREAIRRQKVKPKGLALDVIASMAFSALIVSVLVTGVIVGATPWWHPPVFIPLLGMILGNSLNGVSIALERFLSACRNDRARIEMRLALGATANESVQPILREALRSGMMPIINAMAIVGIVSLPGMMTGQLLAGADPVDAVKYQIVVMYMLAASTTIAGAMALLLARRRVFTKDHSLRL